MGSVNKCAHPNCEAQKPIAQYACKNHWFTLPMSIRNRISRGYQVSASAWLKSHDDAQKYWLKQGEQVLTRQHQGS